MKISFLGPEGTYCYEACNIYTKDKEYTKIGCKTITEAIMLLVNDEVDECIVPIENSIRGSVFETIDSILEHDELKINKEIVLDIKHSLLANQKYKIEEIENIYSHTQALGQCRKYINDNIKNCKLYEVSSTAQGAQKAKECEKSACIANKICADIYNLEIIEENIQDIKNNQTRFFIISKNMIECSENKKISLMFSTLNNPGELYKILGLFNIFEINMSKIESKPARTCLGEYWFWVDIDANINENKVKVLLDIIKEKCSYFRILGMY